MQLVTLSPFYNINFGWFCNHYKQARCEEFTFAVMQSVDDLCGYGNLKIFVMEILYLKRQSL